jgi:hypothetical protein
MLIHKYCIDTSFIIHTDLSYKKINKIIHFLQLLDSKLSSTVSIPDGLYQREITDILNHVYNIQTIPFTENIEIDYTLDI